MKLILVLFALLACVFAYTKYEEGYGCPLNFEGKVKKCCWNNIDSCCEPAEPADSTRTCEAKETLCCKKFVYSMEEGEYEIEFYQG